MGFDKCELCYEAIGITDLFHGISIDSCWHGSELAYCSYCFSSNNCFGCLSLQRGSYAVLNKEYSKSEYQKLTAVIVAQMQARGEWGRFFPRALSPFGYNETVAQEWFPTSEAESVALGYQWREKSISWGGKAVSAVADSISELSANHATGIWECNECKKSFRVIDREITFYSTLGIPVPRNCIDCRQRRRLTLHSRWELWDRTCGVCKSSIKTTFRPDSVESVICENCFAKLL